MEGNGESFASYVERERARLDGEIQAIRQQQRELDAKLDGVDKELAAITAYERAKSGAPIARQSRGGNGRGGSGERRGGGGRRGSRREELLNVIREGRTMSRGDILDKMGLKQDKQGSMSVSNALTALIKNGQLRREGGKYSVAG